MFKHGKTGQVYYSVREKINYYKAVIAGKKDAPAATKRKAKFRLKTLEKLNARTFDEPTLIVTDDKHFGNEMHKPRLGVVVAQDKRGGDRVLVAPIHHRTSKVVVLDKTPDRQIDERKNWVNKSEIYETKYISGVKPLTKYDKAKIRLNFDK